MTITILREGLRERLGSARLAPQRMPIMAEIATLRRRLDVLTSRSELRADVLARAELLHVIAGALEDIKAAMLVGATDLSADEIAEACRVFVAPGDSPSASRPDGVVSADLACAEPAGTRRFLQTSEGNGEPRPAPRSGVAASTPEHQS